MRIVAVPGRLVRDPVTRRLLDAQGIPFDPNDFYWARLIADGDAEVVEDLEPEPEPDAAAQPTIEAEPEGDPDPAAVSAPAEEPKA